MMKSWAEKNAGLAVIALVVMLLMPGASALAHGGEDHGEKKAPVVSAGTGTITRVARVGDFEVTVKHLPIEPDKEIAARVFVTRFETNEPVGKALVFLAFGDGGSAPEVSATATSTPGIYEVKLPPLPKGQYKLTARLDVNGTSGAAQYGAIEVAPAPPPAVESGSSWARTALIALALLVALGVAGMIVYRAVQSARRDRVKGEPVAV
ncbi:MAG: hypothetical protein H0T45_05855 [Pyrinomonadaceae bacterium]|nr:hypothetical protein [Pyrinomonadaceae bacterium]